MLVPIATQPAVSRHFSQHPIIEGVLYVISILLLRILNGSIVSSCVEEVMISHCKVMSHVINKFILINIALNFT